MQELTKEQIKAAREILNRAAYADISLLPERLAEVLQYAPAPIQDDVIEAMFRAARKSETHCGLLYDEDAIKCMLTAAATVLLDAVHSAIVAEAKLGDTSNKYLADRVIAHILKPERTPEEEAAEKIVKQLRCIDLTNEDYSRAARIDIAEIIAKLKREQEEK